MTDSTFYIGLGPNFNLATIFGLKNKLGGEGGAGVKMGKKTPK